MGWVRYAVYRAGGDRGNRRREGGNGMAGPAGHRAKSGFFPSYIEVGIG